MLGYIVLKMDDSGVYPRGEVVDLLTVPGRLDVADALLANVTRIFDERGINMCITRLLEGHPIERVFERHGFFKVSRKTHIFYWCPDMEAEFARRIRETIETTVTGRIHLFGGDFL